MVLAARLKQHRMRSTAPNQQGDVEVSNAVHEGADSGNLGRCSPMEDSEFKAIGVDSCKSGWFYVALGQSRKPDWGVVKKIEDLLPDVGGSDRVFIDIPIGLLTDQSARACDIEARYKLRKRTILPERIKLPSRTSCVFSTPVRAVLGSENYEDAKRRNQKACGIKITRQTWAIVPKIREVDELMRRNEKAKRIVREVHPELCFWALNHRVHMTKSKGEDLGFNERMRVLKAWLPEVESIVTEIQGEKISGVKRDDIVDALAAAATALADPSTLRTLPRNPPRDCFGLSMEMVYADPGLLANCPPKAAL